MSSSRYDGHFGAPDNLVSKPELYLPILLARPKAAKVDIAKDNFGQDSFNPKEPPPVPTYNSKEVAQLQHKLVSSMAATGLATQLWS
jgi:hypothetical protein